MRLAFFVSALSAEAPDYTTTKLAMTATEAGHDVFYLDFDAVSYSPDERLLARAHRTPSNTELPYDSFLELLRDEDQIETIDLADLDVLMLRQEPEIDVGDRPWAPSVGIAIGEMAAQRGVVVLNDPVGLGRAMNKLYLQDFPAHIRPRTLVTRDETESKRFIEELGGRAVIKPLQSAKGENVFLVRPDEDANLNQMIEAVKRDGFIVIQEYLPEAAEGDVRLLLMNGEPLHSNGTVAAVFRQSPDDDLRANISTGGEAATAEVTDEMMAIADAIKPKLVADGMFFVGVDIAGDKLIEINATSAGTLTSSHWTTGVDFSPIIIEELERKVERRRRDPELSNRELATA